MLLGFTPRVLHLEFRFEDLGVVFCFRNQGLGFAVNLRVCRTSSLGTT